ncbi:hypothetical protein HL658_09890 [Azospirillum sp. RWY-5-1]|uniref:Uncharacterized protein n=1 Tax=Azospirillum oleiclasticum TaxID=2735135 RepID=A0ABX2T6W9_9PROT|nr:hypothetical protein [Azospirillum oleiclasticum]NYZ12863.1 hypothetical protein [Azospirillum oleiclasticum]NYZ20023.1 hypothetical protein [Azospirillum oleiclasticum]
MCDRCRARVGGMAEKLHAILDEARDNPPIAFSAALTACARLADATGTGGQLATLLHAALNAARQPATTLPRDLASLEPEGRA